MQATAQGWLVLQLTNSPGLLGLVGAIAGLPTLFLAVVAGVLADRLDRRRLLAWSYGGAALLSASLAVLTITEAVAYWHVAVIALAGGVLLTVQMPASQAIVSTVVDRAVLGGAIALNSDRRAVARGPRDRRRWPGLRVRRERRRARRRRHRLHPPAVATHPGGGPASGSPVG
jgi:MFS family permease